MATSVAMFLDYSKHKVARNPIDIPQILCVEPSYGITIMRRSWVCGRDRSHAPVKSVQGKELSPMAEEGQIVRGINWRQTFPFTNIFRAFRVAIHLSKLALGLALLLCIYCGGRLMDSVWPATARAIPGEVYSYEAFRTGQMDISLPAWREQRRAEIQQDYARMLVQYGVDKTDEQAMDDARARHKLGELTDAINNQRQLDVDKINTDFAEQKRAAPDEATRDQVDKAHYEAVLAAYAQAAAQREEARAIEGQGLFISFFQYEIHEVNAVVMNVLRNTWLAPGGVTDHVYNFFAIGPIWLVWHHTVFFILFAVWFLICWALFGGAISRIAAVHVARDEKISVRQAMKFAVGKLLSFASAPVIPILIVIVVGLLVALVSLIGNVPFLGPIIIGAMFVLALLAGFVMTLVVLGTAGGFNLMYPTIAVEGSDSFDAISRSFSYVYARPWRMLFYTAVAVGYGAATYLFIHLFIWLMLVLTHHFVNMGLFTMAGNGRDLLSVMWPSPSITGRLSYSADYSALTSGQKIGGLLINCWVMLLVAFLGAYAISLYFSANTIIYFLMRGEVDSTEMDDVYLEQSEDDLETAPAAVVTATEVVKVTLESAPTGSMPVPPVPPPSPPPPPITST
jgi:hypothetical protein